ncbi:protein kinase domain-containing protein 28 [Elsinoe australis]|uniref:Protein kinase domain-containing protein 28 n=1 Tax=Elsinoe australis TaxID=40998 RepID=A0A4U7AYI7_9PEZI|nr:protein kinase domain-containing protein 28 [Elsinoe australis]
MTVAIDSSFRGWASHHNHNNVNPAITLEDKYEIVKEVGDGSFGSVVLGRTRSAGATVVRRNTMVAIKTMKKTFDNFAQCLELREVIFLKTLPPHQHLVPAYDIFLDPLSRKLHIAMEYMDGNLYQLMKSRDHKPLDGASVKSILFQILSGLEHIHDHDFFHRDIKPENILVTSSAPENGNAFKRYSSLMTPPSTPPTYTIKLADFGLARETHSRTPYTTYVSTRWYRAPEVLLRAGEYSAPVDIWALGAMAVEIATLKPLFPGANEVDQVWRVCEIMGSPGVWVNKHGQKVGGGEWKEGVKLASKLGFSFPKMAPHSLTTVMPLSQWPASLVEFVTWCLLWDPKARPTSTQALAHEYFADAVDPLRPKSASTSRLLGRKHNEQPDSPHSLTTKTSSWFRRSLGPREFSTPVQSEQSTPVQPLAVRPLPAQAVSDIPVATTKPKPVISKRASWTNSATSNAAPIPILPSIRPVSPLPDAATAQGTSNPAGNRERPSKKLGRQLSVNSSNNHYADYHRQEAEKALNGGASGLSSPTSGTKESFFSHLRKRARRFSGKYGAPASPPADDVPAYGYTSNRTSIIVDPQEQEYDPQSPSKDSGFAELDKVLNNVRYSLEGGSKGPEVPPKQPHRTSSFNSLRRLGSLHKVSEQQAEPGANMARTRRSVRYALRQEKRYETPDEEDELLDEALASADKVARNLERHAHDEAAHYGRRAPQHIASDPAPVPAPYLTPSPSKENNSVNFGQLDAVPSKPVNIKKTPARANHNPQWPTPPYEENDWASAAAASIFAAQATHR